LWSVSLLGFDFDVQMAVLERLDHTLDNGAGAILDDPGLDLGLDGHQHMHDLRSHAAGGESELQSRVRELAGQHVRATGRSGLERSPSVNRRAVRQAPQTVNSDASGAVRNSHRGALLR
jgi:hypothetical protein